MYTYDPRPSSRRNDPVYPSHFRHSVLTYTGPDSDMPVKQLYEPANPYGLVNDHNHDIEEKFLHTKKVNIYNSTG